MKKNVLRIIGIVYVLLAIFLTVCLLNYNEMDIPQFGNKVLLTADKDTDYCKKGALLITKKTTEFKEKDVVVYYSGNNEVKIGDLLSYNDEVAMVGSDSVNSKNIIGLKDNTKFIGALGSILSFLTKKVVYLFVVVLPILVLFVYEIYLTVKFVKNEKKGDSDEKTKKPSKEKGSKNK